MKFRKLLVALIGVVLGPIPGSAEQRLEQEPASRGSAVGHVIRGPEFYVWDEDEREAADWALNLRKHRTSLVRSCRFLASRTAGQAAVLSPEDEEELAAWVLADGATAALSPLGLLLCTLPSLDRTCLITAWATSSEEPIRQALARALGAPFEAVGVAAVLEQLTHDESPAVRRLARAAAVQRERHV